MISASQALEELKAGNQRFITETSFHENKSFKYVANQLPIAVVLGCADSRVPMETLFDQGIGDLFVIRIAGNVVTPMELGSAEFAAAVLGTKLIVVLGHTKCGAVQATYDAVMSDGSDDQDQLPAGIQSIIDHIRPAIIDSVHDGIDAATESNVRASMRDLKSQSETLSDLCNRDELLIEGAIYSVETGRVSFLKD